LQITSVLTNAQPRTVNRRDGSGSFLLYELFDHEGTPWVAKKDVYDGALYLIGQPVDMIVRVEQNGQWTNRFVDIVSPAQAGAQVPQSNAATLALQQAQAAAQQAQRIQPQPVWPQQTQQPQITQAQMPQLQPISTFPTEKDRSIHRQTAAKVAATISNSPSELWANCLDLARYFDSGQTPASHSANPPQVQAQYAEAGEGYYNTPPPHDDSTVPF
jgi:hypothetical protein